MSGSNKNRGFSLLEIIIVLAVMSFSFLIFYKILTNIDIYKENKGLSQQISKYISLAESSIYSKKNFADIRDIDFNNKLNCKMSHNDLNKIQCNIDLKSPLLDKKPILTIYNQGNSSIEGESTIITKISFNISSSKDRYQDFNAKLVKEYLEEQSLFSINFKVKKNIVLVNKHIVSVQLVGKVNSENWLKVNGENTMKSSLVFANNKQPHYIKNVASILYSNSAGSSHIQSGDEMEVIASLFAVNSKSLAIDITNLNMKAMNINFSGLNQNGKVDIANSPGIHNNKLVMYDLNIKEKSEAKKFSQSKVVKRKLMLMDVVGISKYNISPSNDVTIAKPEMACDVKSGGKIKIITTILSSEIYTKEYIVKTEKQGSKTIYMPEMEDINTPKFHMGVKVADLGNSFLLEAINGNYDVQTILICDYSES